MIKKIFLLNLLLLLCIFSLHAQAVQTATIPNEITPGEAAIRQKAFDKVWNTVNEKHYDPTLGGVDWEKVREIYQPQAMSAKSLAEFHSVLNKMLGELKLSHFAVFMPPANVSAEKSTRGIIGVDLTIIDNKPVVSRVQGGSTAEQAGIKTGYIIEKIDGRPVMEILAPLEKSFQTRKLTEAQINLYRERTVSSALGGSLDSKVSVEVLNAQNKPQVFEVAHFERKGEMSQPLGNFPAQEVNFEAKRLSNNIGYIRFNMWIIPQMAKIRAAIASMSDAPGIIIDLRGNPGGVGGMATGMAGLMVKEQMSLGTMKGRTNETRFVVYPQANSFAGKVMILSDYGTGSTSEVFAAGMQEAGRVKVIGERSAGAVLPSVFDKLPTGALFQYAISDYKSPKNILIEGRGVIPDVEVKQTRKALLEGRDLPLEEAIKQINQTN